MRKIKSAIVGYGYWGVNVARSLNQNQNFKLACVLDEDTSRIDEANKLYALKHYACYEAMLKDDEIEAVFIVTPPQMHYSLAKKALLAKKHIFVEKPLTTNLKEAYALYELAEKMNVKIHCDHIFLYSPAVSYLKSEIEHFGEIVYIHARRINLGLFQRHIDVIWDLAIHDLSIIDELVGLEIKKVATFSKKYQGYPNDALANISIELKSGIIATISVSWLSPIKVREMIIGGTQKSAIYNDVQREKVRIYDAGIMIKDEFDANSLYAKMVEYRLGEEQIPKLPTYMSLDRSIQTFADLILGDSPSNREHVLRVIEALEVISKV